MPRKRQGSIHHPFELSTSFLTGLVGSTRKALRSRWHKIHHDLSVETYQIEHQSRQRSYVLYTPAWYDPQQTLPLVLFFHGGYGSADRAFKHKGINEIAEREGFIVAYPDAAPDKHWRDGRATVEAEIDDIDFVSTVISHVEQIRNINVKRIYAAGFSNGGAFTARLACELSGRIAAFAQVVSTMAEELREICKPERPVPIMIISGTEDPLVPWQGGERAMNGKYGKGGKILSVPDVVKFWVSNNHCETKPEIKCLCNNPDDESLVTRYRYRNEPANVEVVHIVIEGGGHTWPGAPKRPHLEEIVGESTQYIDAGEVIWNFFDQFELH